MFEIFAHTADAGLRVAAADRDGLFADAGRALFSLIVSNLDDVETRIQKRFAIEGSDVEFLLVDWLGELLFAFESERLLLSKFNVSVGDDGLTATAGGEVIDERRHQLDHEVKAITYHDLTVRQADKQWTATVIVDI